MTFELTKKSVFDTGYPVYSFGYCKIQAIVSREIKEGYITSSYGWNCDVYAGLNIVITTGYRPIGIKLEKELENLVERMEAACGHCRSCYKGFNLLADLCYFDYKVHKERDKTYSGVLENTVEKINYYIEICEKEVAV